jgi:hypothetical protein
MTSPSLHHARPAITALFAVLALTVSAAFANHSILVLAAADVAFEDASDSDKAVTTMGVSVTCEGGPAVVVLHKKGAGSLGDATVPGYAVDDLPTNALGETLSDEAAAWVGVVTPYPGGVTFAIDDTRFARLMAVAMNALQSGGCSIADHGRTANAFGFSSGGVDYRAVFNTAEGGTLVYLGH